MNMYTALLLATALITPVLVQGAEKPKSSAEQQTLQRSGGPGDVPVRVDKIDYPFVDDPALVGGWRGVDRVAKSEDFDPAKLPTNLGIPPSERFLLELVVKPNGKTSWSAANWTRGLILNPVSRTASRYEIREMQGRTYLFMEWKNGDYRHRGATPWFYVMENDPRVVDVETRVTDKIDYPFVEDPEARGTWNSVDFVDTIEQFRPGRKNWGEDLYLKGMELLEDGRSQMKLASGKTYGGCTWTRGLVLNSSDKTAAKYQIKTLEGRSYLFMEWKNGDYVRGKQAPSYYVMTK